jgi:hypothetical protein
MSKLPGTTEAGTQARPRTAIVTGASQESAPASQGPSSIVVIMLLLTLCILQTQRWWPMETSPLSRETSGRLQPL